MERSVRFSLGGDRVEGRRAVIELLAAHTRTIERVLLADGLEPSAQLDRIEALAAARKVRVQTVSRARLIAEARTDSPQGVVAVAHPIEPVSLSELCRPRRGRPPFLLVAAGVGDPHNLGSLLRSAECAGVTGIVLPRHRSASLSPAVAKVAAGAMEHLTFCVVGGVPAAIAQLVDCGIRALGLVGESPRSLYSLNLADSPIALVVGSEERGLAPLVRRRCDDVVSIPRRGAIPSLNVAAAGAVACFEVARQRTAGHRGSGDGLMRSDPGHEPVVGLEPTT